MEASVSYQGISVLTGNSESAEESVIDSVLPVDQPGSRILIVYTTRYGHTRRIATAISEEFASAGSLTTVVRLGKDVPPSAENLASDYDCVIVGGPVYFGRLSPQLNDFVRRNHEILSVIPNAFFSVSLSAASSDSSKRNTLQSVVHTFFSKTQWQPCRVATFAGAILYSQYGPLTRFLMRHVFLMQKSDTDVPQDHVFTQWDQIPEFVDHIQAMLNLAGTVKTD